MLAFLDSRGAAREDIVRMGGAYEGFDTDIKEV